MADIGQPAGVVEELIGVLQLQAHDPEKLISHVEQVTTRLPEANEMSVVRSQLAALHVRAKKLHAARGPTSP
jgi:hypothetical protein